MKKGAQKVIKIHDKSTLGRPWVDFLTPWGDFGGGRKIFRFLDRSRGGQKTIKIEPRAAKRRIRDFDPQEGCGQRGSGGPGAASRATRYEVLRSMKQNP